MEITTRLPAYPLVTSDPFISIWSRSDNPAKSDTTHWSGARKRMTLTAVVDGQEYSLLGRQRLDAAQFIGAYVTPTATKYKYTAGGAALELCFRAPLLMDDFDLMSMPVTFVECMAVSQDGGMHDVEFIFDLHDDICYNGIQQQPMMGDSFISGGLNISYMGKRKQNILCQSGDHITIDWGYAYLAGKTGISFTRNAGHYALRASAQSTVGAEKYSYEFLIAYDDVASINYFGHIAKAWYTRNGAGILDAIHHCDKNRSDILSRCAALDGQLLTDAHAAGGKPYAALVAAAYRHSISAHKLIADSDGAPVFLSKENDSNGCIGTADVSYPSMPLYLLYAPELVRAMCRPILKFAQMPVWTADFAPHDVGRYPHATGQVYGLRQDMLGGGLIDNAQNGDTHAPVYLYGADRDIYYLKSQMPIEECGNMILMLAASMKADGDSGLVRAHLPLLQRWADYMIKYGADPGEQLCTDDFAGHLAHNVNLACKAVCGIAAYSWMLGELGEEQRAQQLLEKARGMASEVYSRARRDGHTALTLNGGGWSLKYNAIWDILFNFGLWEDEFFTSELEHYAGKTNEYGVPLDSRADYTKSDWIMWVAAMGKDAAAVESFARPLERYLAKTPSRVPFSDWYDTKTGAFVQFIARSVQGGIFMPLLKLKWAAAGK